MSGSDLVASKPNLVPCAQQAHSCSRLPAKMGVKSRVASLNPTAREQPILRVSRNGGALQTADQCPGHCPNWQSRRSPACPLLCDTENAQLRAEFFHGF